MANARAGFSGRLIAVIILILAIGAGYGYLSRKKQAPSPAPETTDNSGREQAKPQDTTADDTQKPPAQQDAPQEKTQAGDPYAGWKTLTSAAYNYELKYPDTWGYLIQNNDEFYVEFGPGKPQIGQGVLGLDLVCIFAIGFEGTDQASSTTENVTYGSMNYTKQNSYQVSGGEKNLILQTFNFDFPDWFKNSHSYGSDQSYYQTSCKGGSFIVRKPINADILSGILSNFKFVQ